ncbi:unnamed protein product [Linum tenue]|uniref:Homeobox domain-containing protein n=1 Tax=Linum tenue TaxID=586396 RepID=A0AAV0J687_9ROSI|nr:unnamed protein product [Linum tenue]
MASSSSVEDHALLLGLTLSTTHHNNRTITPAAKPNNSGAHSTFEPSLSLTLLSGNGDSIDQVSAAAAAAKNSRQEASPPNSAVSSFSAASGGGGGRMVMKRERDVLSSTDEMETAERVVSSRASDEDDDDGGGSTAARKKLRLTKDQSALLEESFKHHSTLNPFSQKQKQALARQLNLRARQVEVWFQNRRARTKLKQTEVDCELLKKCCETLTDENRRLHKELQELKALKSSPPQPAAAAPPQFYMRVPAATLSLCPSCERIGGGPAVAAAAAPAAGGADHHRGGSSSSSSSAFSMAQKPQFFNPFTNPSAAC